MSERGQTGPPGGSDGRPEPSRASSRLARLRSQFSPMRLRLMALGLALVSGLALVLLFGAMEVSSRPQMCGACHVMQPYYQSWKQSTHNQVACVECHIPPGVTAEFRKKFEAVAMVARYFTGTYGTNPWAEIDDSACLRCHERRLIKGKELFGKILFDHTPHLTELRRQKKLRCTSCHSQMVQGSHISVTTSTCILCHFKGQQLGEGTARCTLCHQIPQHVVRSGGMEFDHSDVSRFAMKCSWCHSHAASGEGRVPKERCLTCHNDPNLLSAADEVERLHRSHVTDHKVDCLHCHLEIEHATGSEFAVAKSECAACHTTGHSPQRDLYAGIGGKGVPPQPSTMFLAGVRCEGCHFVSEEGNDGRGVQRASDVSCMSCHGPGYRKIYLQWQRTLSSRVAAVRAALRQLSARPTSNDSQTVRDARANLALVERGNGIHNVGYAFALLEKAHDLMNTERAVRGLPPKTLAWARAGEDSSCSRCHAGVEAQSGRFKGRRFEHRPHLLKAGLECVSCHRPHEERAGSEVVRFDVEECDSCHHRDVRQGAGTPDCAACHGDVRKRDVSTGRGAFSHSMHLEMAGEACDLCHSLQAGRAPRVNFEICADCHD